VKKSPKKSPGKNKKEDESNYVDKKPKMETVDDKSTSKYFKDVKTEPQKESESLQKIQKMKEPKKKVTIKKEPNTDVCTKHCKNMKRKLKFCIHYRINQLVESQGEELQGSEALLSWHLLLF
jgi:hypothetical protein